MDWSVFIDFFFVVCLCFIIIYVVFCLGGGCVCVGLFFVLSCEWRSNGDMCV